MTYTKIKMVFVQFVPSLIEKKSRCVSIIATQLVISEDCCVVTAILELGNSLMIPIDSMRRSTILKSTKKKPAQCRLVSNSTVKVKLQAQGHCLVASSDQLA